MCIASASPNRHAGRVNRILRAGAIAAACIAAVQTVLDAMTSLLSIASFVLTAVTLAVVLFRRTPLTILWLVLGADLLQVIHYASAFDNPVGALLYGTLLLPFVAPDRGDDSRPAGTTRQQEASDERRHAGAVVRSSSLEPPYRRASCSGLSTCW